MLEGPIADLFIFLFSIIIFFGSIAIILSIIYCLIKIFKFIHRFISSDYVEVPLDTPISV